MELLADWIQKLFICISLYKKVDGEVNSRSNSGILSLPIGLNLPYPEPEAKLSVKVNSFSFKDIFIIFVSSNYTVH